MSDQRASQRIGLESFVGTDAFEKGMMKYINGLMSMNKATDVSSKSLSGNMGNAAANVGQMLADLVARGNPVLNLFSKMNFLALTLATTLGHILLNALTSIVSKLKEMVSGGIMAAARVQELDFVLQVLGRRLGYTKEELDGLVQSIVEYGIRTDVAQNLIQQFIRYNMNLAQAVDLARVAQDTAVISMTDSSEMLDRLIWGIQRYDTQILRTGGINITTADAFKKYAEEIGKTADQLSEAEKQQAFLNAVLAEGARNAGIYEAAMEAPGKQLRSFSREAWELVRILAEPFLPAFAAVVKTMREVAKVFTIALAEGGRLHEIMIFLGAVASIVADAFRHFVTTGADDVIEFFAALPEYIQKGVDFIINLADEAYDWGYNIISNLSIGMADAVSAVTDVLLWVADVITGWLIGHSPPKLLPDLNKWGAQAMQEYLLGWTMADFSIFNEIAGILTRYIQSISLGIGDEGLIPMILGTREAIAKAISLVNEVGEVTQEAVDIIMSAFGEANPIIEEYIRLMLEIEQAIQDVNAAAEDIELLQSLNLDNLEDADEIISNLSDSMKGLGEDYVAALEALAAANQEVSESQEYLNEVTEFYNDILSNLQAQMAEFTLEDNADRIAEINKAIASGLLTQDEIEKLEKEKLELQIDSIEVLKKLETDAAEDKVDAAKEAQDAAAEAAKEAQDAAMAVATANLEAAQAQQQAIAEQLSMYQQMIAMQTEQNQLIQQQIKLLEQLAAKAAAAGGGAGGGLPDMSDLGEGIFDNLTDAITEKIDDMKEKIKDKFAEIVEDVKVMFRGLAQPLFPLINALFGTNLGTDKVSGNMGGGGGSGGLFGAVKAVFDPIIKWMKTEIPPAIQTFLKWWNGVLLPALSDGWKWFQDDVLPVLEDIRVWLVDNLPPAIEALGKLWDETLQPAIEAFGNFLIEHGPAILAFLAGFVGTLWLIVNVSTFLAGAFAFVSQAIAWVSGLIIALTSPVGLLAVAIGLLAAAWVGDWFHIRWAVTDVWNRYLKPIFEAIKDWLEVKLKKAIEFLAEKWEDIKKAWQAMVDYWNEVPGPLIAAIIELIEVTWALAIDYLADKWENTLKPALVAVYEYIRDFIQPIFTALSDFFGETIQPAIDSFGTFLEETFMPILHKLLHEFLEPIFGVFGDINDAIGNVTEKITTFTDKLKDSKLPKWAQKNSPSEIEQTLTGMIKSMDILSNRSIPSLAKQMKDIGNVNVSNMGGMSTGAGNVTNVQNTKNVQVSVNPTYQQQQSLASVYYDIDAALLAAGL